MDKIELAGVYEVILYEGKGIQVTYDEQGNVDEVYTQGQQLTITNMLEPIMTIKGELNKNNRISYEYELTYKHLGTDNDSMILQKQIAESIYGWYPRFRMYNQDDKYLNYPLYFQNTETDWSKAAAWITKLTTNTSTQIQIESAPAIQVLPEDAWIELMVSSYLAIHEPTNDWTEDMLRIVLASNYADTSGTGYYYNTFGPAGQNRQVCDFMYVFRQYNNVSTDLYIDVGGELRVNMQGKVYVLGNDDGYIPAYDAGLPDIYTVFSSFDFSKIGYIMVSMLFGLGDLPRFNFTGWNGYLFAGWYNVDSLQVVHDFSNFDNIYNFTYLEQYDLSYPAPDIKIPSMDGNPLYEVPFVTAYVNNGQASAIRDTLDLSAINRTDGTRFLLTVNTYDSTGSFLNIIQPTHINDIAVEIYNYLGTTLDLSNADYATLSYLVWGNSTNKTITSLIFPQAWRKMGVISISNTLLTTLDLSDTVGIGRDLGYVIQVNSQLSINNNPNLTSVNWPTIWGDLDFVYIYANNLTQVNINALCVSLKNYYNTNAPTRNMALTINNPIQPTGGVSNTNLVALKGYYTAAGKTLTLTVS